MSYPKSLPQFYASLLEFVMTSKQSLVALSADFDLTLMQAVTLLIVDIDEPKPMNAFQKLYNCDASNVTGIVDGLEEKGLESARTKNLAAEDLPYGSTVRRKNELQRQLLQPSNRNLVYIVPAQSHRLVAGLTCPLALNQGIRPDSVASP